VIFIYFKIIVIARVDGKQQQTRTSLESLEKSTQRSKTCNYFT